MHNEFGLHMPIGYADAAAGAHFPKIGVGFLQKTDDRPYEFMVDYPLEPAPITVEQMADDVVTFTQTADRGGWGWRLRKTLTVQATTLTIAYALINTGSRALNTEEYCHNFFAINGQTVGPDYQVRLPFQPKLAPILGPLLVTGNTITLNRIPEQSFWAAQTACGQRPDVTWTLTHRPSGHGLEVTEHFPLQRFQIWGMRHVISPELFVEIAVNPGDTQTWKRTYIFF